MPDESSSSRPRRSFRAKVTLSAIAALMTLVSLELALAALAPHELDFYNGAKILRPSTRPGQRHELIPNSVNESYIGVPVRINSLGLRDREISAQKPDRTFRILALGDSITFGYGVRLEDTYVKRLEARLQKSLAASRSADVINTGLEASGLGYYVNFLRTTGAQLEPDLVLVGIALNDINDAADRSSGGHARGWAASSTFRRLNAFMRSHSHLYFSVYGDLKSILYRTGIADINRQFGDQLLTVMPPSPRQERAWQLSLARLQELIDLARTLKAPLVLVVFPMEVQLGAESREVYRKALGLRLHENVDYNAPQRRLAQFARAQGVPIIDLLPRFREMQNQGLFLRNQVISHDWAHPSPAGHDLAADEIHQHLVRFGIVPVAAAPGK